MDEMEIRLKEARADPREMERLISDYIPFIKKQIGGKDFSLEYDDRLSLAMLAFVNCVRQYEEGRGSFLFFCASCIRNRLIDEGRRQMGYRAKVVPLVTESEEGEHSASGDAASLAAYDMEREKASLREEIEALRWKLREYGIAFEELPRICPKQERSRKQCLELAKKVVGTQDFRLTLQKQRRLVQAELAQIFCISPKTIEKHRKYIVTLSVLLMGDYPGIQAFLPQYREVR